MFDKYSMYITYATPLCIKKISMLKDQDGRLILHMFRFIYVGRAWGLDDGPLSWVLTVDMVRSWWGNGYLFSSYIIVAHKLNQHIIDGE